MQLKKCIGFRQINIHVDSAPPEKGKIENFLVCGPTIVDMSDPRVVKFDESENFGISLDFDIIPVFMNQPRFGLTSVFFLVCPTLSPGL